jgi:gliding motility-associated-like protein
MSIPANIKSLIIGCSLTCLSLLSWAQLFNNDGADVTIQNNTSVVVQGDLSNNNNGFFDNDGQIFVSGHWTNNVINGALNPNRGQVILNGGSQNIAGTDSTTFHQLIIQGSGDKTITAKNTGQTGAVVTDSLALDNNILHLNQRTLHITSSDTDAITRNSGMITSETTDGSPPNTNHSKIKWDIGNNTGRYLFPFATLSGVYVPFTYDITSAGSTGGSVVASTYPTDWDNTPLADDSTITNMQIDQNTPKPEEAVNRFWRLDLRSYSTQPTADLRFSWEDNANLCKDATCSNVLSESSLVAQRWVATPNQWELPYLNGTVNTANNTLDISGVGTSYSWWTLTNNCATLYANGGSDTSICQSDTVTLNASATGGDGAYNYSWSPADSLSCTNCANPQAYPDTTTDYEITITDGNSCVDVDTVRVNVNSSPIQAVSPPDTAICKGDSARLTVSGGIGYGWSWSPSSSLNCDTCSSVIAFPSNNTTYQITVTTAAGCSGDTAIDVTVHDPPTASINTDTATICKGDSAQLTASGGNNYTWSPPTNLTCTNCPDPSAFPDTNTTYNVVVEDANGCTDDTSVAVMTVTPPQAAINQADTAICENDTLSLQASGGTSYNWSPSSGLSCTNCPNPDASPNSNTTYTVTVTNAGGCSDDTSITISTLSAPTATINQDTFVHCSAADTSLLIASGGTSYSWSPTTDLSCSTCDSTQAFPSTTTDYTVSVSNSNGCDDQVTTTVAVGSPPNIQLNTDSTAICAGDSVQLDASATGANSYTWSPNSGLNCIACPDPIASPNSSTDYVLTAADSLGCTSDTTVNLTVFPQPPLTTTPDTTICEGRSVILKAQSSNVTYQWSGPNIDCDTCSTTKASPASSTTYGIQITGKQEGCTNEDTVRVTLIAPSQLTVTPAQDSICEGDSVLLAAQGGENYQWEPTTHLSAPNSAQTYAYPDTSTRFMVVMEDSICRNRKDTGTINITVSPLPQINARPDTTIIQGNSVRIQAQTGYTYAWSPAQTLNDSTFATPLATPLETTTYTAQAVTEFGCAATDSVTIQVTNEIPFTIPNTFTPNGDGINDQWVIEGLKLFDEVRVEIYNRWGQMVYENDNYDNSWQGSYQGKPLPAATYYYVLKLKEEATLTGTVTIIR